MSSRPKSLTRDCIYARCVYPKKKEHESQLIVQVLDVKDKITQGKPKSIILKLSDGIYSVRGLIKDVNEEFVLNNFDIVQLQKHEVMESGGKSILIMKQEPRKLFTGLQSAIGMTKTIDMVTNVKAIGDAETRTINLSIPEYAKWCEEIGKSPAALPQEERKENMGNMGGRLPHEMRGPPSAHPREHQKDEIRRKSGQRQLPKTVSGLNKDYRSINSLTLFVSEWTIKARLIHKAEIKHYKNQKGEGQLLKLVLIDEEETQIEAVLFNELVDKFAAMLQVGDVYYWKNGQVKLANKQYSSINNDMQITFDKTTSITEVANDESIKDQGYTFVKINDLQNREIGSTVDVIGVLERISDSSTFQAKDGQSFNRRSATICDETGKIEITLWREFASLDLHVNIVTAFKSVNLKEFNGKNLNSTINTQVFTKDIDHPRRIDIENWLMSNPNLSELQSFHEGGKPTADKSRFISEIKELENTADQEKGSYYLITAYPNHLSLEKNLYYQGCPDCKKKVIEEGIGSNKTFNCVGCSKDFTDDQIIVRYVFNCNFVDATGDLWVTCFGEQGEAILGGLTAREARSLKESENETALKGYFNLSKNTEKTFLVRGTLSTYNDDTRFKYSMVKMYEQDFMKITNSLLSRVYKYKLKQ